MRVSKNSNAGSVAGAIAGLLRTGDEAVLEVVGAAATYQAVCAIAIANDFLKDDGIKPVITIENIKKEIGGITRTQYSICVTGDK